MIPVETLRLAQETAVKAAGVEVREIPGDPETLIVAQDGRYDTRKVPPARIAHEVFSLEDLINYGRRCDEATEDVTPRSVWHTSEQVVLILDDADRRDRVTFRFATTKAFDRLKALEAADSGWCNQQNFVRMLKIEFGVNAAIVATFRTLDFKRGDASHADLQHGRETLGKSVESAVQGLADIPEELVISLPIYRSVEEQAVYHVRCAVEINSIQGLFKLTPLPLELDAALQSHQDDIHSRLVAGLPDAGVFFGAP